MKVGVASVKNVPGKIVQVELEERLAPIMFGSDSIKVLDPVKFVGKIENVGKTLIVKGDLSTLLELECSRCTENFSYQLNIPFEEEYSNNSEVLSSLEGEEKDIHPFEGDEIDIALQIEQNILIHLPMKILCNEECEGLCPVCGINLNKNKCQCRQDDIDPRLMALGKLLKESSTEGGVTSGSTKKKNI